WSGSTSLVLWFRQWPLGFFSDSCSALEAASLWYAVAWRPLLWSMECTGGHLTDLCCGLDAASLVLWSMQCSGCRISYLCSGLEAVYLVYAVAFRPLHWFMQWPG
ncbi:hypothetical protein NDU88_003876, partial [Pleurodeles waltl]